jgi:hypothetical protein
MSSLLFYYPNRPILMPPDEEAINGLEASGKFIAELKKNGDNTSLYTDTLTFMNRQHEKLRYNPTPEVTAELQKFPKGCIVNMELVHYHTKTVKNLLVVHCLMAWRGRPLIGKKWGDSRTILENEFQFGSHVVLSPVWKTGFWKLFQQTDGVIDEGIILKKPEGRLIFSTSPIPDVSWMLKIRKPSKKYPF